MDDSTDPNLAAIHRAGLDPAHADWLRRVAAQVPRRLDRIQPSWRDGGQADAASACAFGLLLARLAGTYPHTREQLSRVAEAHPSYSALLTGSRLSTLEQIASDPARMTSWVGPLIGVSDPQRMSHLFD